MLVLDDTEFQELSSPPEKLDLEPELELEQRLKNVILDVLPEAKQA